MSNVLVESEGRAKDSKSVLHVCALVVIRRVGSMNPKQHGPRHIFKATMWPMTTTVLTNFSRQSETMMIWPASVDVSLFFSPMNVKASSKFGGAWAGKTNVKSGSDFKKAHNLDISERPWYHYR
jgi:hypothetical protein